MTKKKEIDNEPTSSSTPQLILNEDYYINESGYWVFTAAYHLKRGYCCQQGCKHCPYRNTDDK